MKVSASRGFTSNLIASDRVRLLFAVIGTV